MCSSVTEENPSMLVIMLSKQVEVVLQILVGSFIVTMRPKLLIVEINVLAFRVFDNKSMLKSPARMISAYQPFHLHNGVIYMTISLEKCRNYLR